jgi:hypothetical protein
MMRRSASLAFGATPLRRYWVAEADDPTAPNTTFKNVKPGPLLRLWRQIRHRAWILWTFDEEMSMPHGDSYMYNTRMEQAMYSPTNSYGSTPGSYCDPLLYNTKSTSPFRWHTNMDDNETVGHWYLEIDELQRLKEWKPKNPDDPFEMFPHPPRIQLAFDESVDEHGNRTFRYKYRYDPIDPHGGTVPNYPFSTLYAGGPNPNDRVEAYGFKQGEFLRANAEEEEVIRRIMEEEDREWERVKRTEIIQEPWQWPGKIRPDDLANQVEHAKKKWRENVKAGRPTDPTKDPNYDLVQASEQVYPRDGPRAEWRHLWFENRDGTPEEKMVADDLKYRSTFNQGSSAELNENPPEPYPGFIDEVHGAEKYYKTHGSDGRPLRDQTIPIDEAKRRQAAGITGVKKVDQPGSIPASGEPPKNIKDH